MSIDTTGQPHVGFVVLELKFVYSSAYVKIIPCYIKGMTDTKIRTDCCSKIMIDRNFCWIFEILDV
jgi:hypothetical protein